MKNVLLIGASGYVGTAILNELLDRGHKVTAVVRDPAKIKITNPDLKIITADVEDAKTVIDLCSGKDAVISAYNPGWSNPEIYEDTLRVYNKLLDDVKKAGVKRFLIVGGAGTLFVKPGVRLIDTGMIPEEILPGVKSLGKFYLETLMNEKDIDWVFFSPAANLGDRKAGKRTGKFRLGKDDMIVDKDGKSFISVEDYAMAMVDELEQQNHHRERFTVGY